MKVLLVHHLDLADSGPWAGQRWDRIVDLGIGGVDTYNRWQDRFGCPVVSLNSFHARFDDFRRIRELLGLGCGQVIDQYGLDWWEILSILLHEEVETLLLLERLAKTIGTEEEVFVSRPCIHARILQCLLGTRLTTFPFRRGAGNHTLTHYMHVYKRLSASQMIDVLGDKYDAGYRLRRRFARRPRRSGTPIVLLPTAYVNVSRTGLAYANSFPDENFLLLATRRSGRIKNPPPNIATGWLSSYAPAPRDHQYECLEKKWQSLLNNIAGTTEFGILREVGALSDFPRRLHNALRVRDAWQNVLDVEPVRAVLCADDSNPYTRIPLLLAREKGLASIACHHGALDGRYVFKRSYGHVIWVKGKMEEAYLVRKCGVPRERVEIAAPALPKACSVVWNSERPEVKPHILFLSEASEVSAGRPEEFYRELLGPLADLARSTGRKLIVKLHPAESEPERKKTISKILSSQQIAVTRVVSGPLNEELFAGAWFGITILSTVAVECAIRGIPCFLCKWLEYRPYEYVEQFIRFGAGIELNGPNEIRKIPQYLEQYRAQTDAVDIFHNCWEPVASGRLQEFVSSIGQVRGSSPLIERHCVGN
jgi:hypothetical protein